MVKVENKPPISKSQVVPHKLEPMLIALFLFKNQNTNIELITVIVYVFRWLKNGNLISVPPDASGLFRIIAGCFICAFVI